MEPKKSGVQWQELKFWGDGSYYHDRGEETQSAEEYYISLGYRLPEGTPIPEWVLDEIETFTNSMTISSDILIYVAFFSAKDLYAAIEKRYRIRREEYWATDPSRKQERWRLEALVMCLRNAKDHQSAYYRRPVQRPRNTPHPYQAEFERIAAKLQTSRD